MCCTFFQFTAFSLEAILMISQSDGENNRYPAYFFVSFCFATKSGYMTRNSQDSANLSFQLLWVKQWLGVRPLCFMLLFFESPTNCSFV